MSTSISTVMAHLERAVADGALSRADVDRAVDVLRSAGSPTTGTSRPPDRREQILAVAARHLAQRGYSGTNLKDIAAEVDCTRQAFYYHFKNKEEILATVTDVAISRVERLLERLAAETTSPPDPAAQIRAFIRGFVELNASHPESAALFRAFGELPAQTQELMRKRMGVADRAVADILAAGVEAGRFQCDDVRISAMAIIGSINWMHQWYRPDGRLSWDGIADTITALHLDGLTRGTEEITR